MMAIQKAYREQRGREEDRIEEAINPRIEASPPRLPVHSYRANALRSYGVDALVREGVKAPFVGEASVREQLRKMWPCTKTSLTSFAATIPSMLIRSKRRCRSLICSSSTRIGPSPPMITSTLGCRAST